MLRAAGTAEFAGFDLSLSPVRIRNVLNLMQQILPRVQFKESGGKPWCGLRPMSVDGVPIIGATPISNLFVNSGHGHLGWTMAAGSASVLGDAMSAAAAGIDPAPYRLARFDARCRWSLCD
jgi:D-amino-acid dehydrogenase